MRNVEYKARIGDYRSLMARARELGADLWGDLRQTDTYFRVQHGRLKVRETAGRQAELVFYERDEAHPDRPSDYTIVFFPDGGSLKEALSRALEIVAIVKKTRTLLVLDGTRLHFDDVEGLGRFIELEVPVSEDDAVAAAHLASLLASLGMRPEDGIRASYADLVGVPEPQPGRAT